MKFLQLFPDFSKIACNYNTLKNRQEIREMYLKLNAILLIFTLLCLSCNYSGRGRFPSSDEKTFHIVFDIDWTITSQLREGENELIPKDSLLHVEKESYRINDRVREMIHSLSKRENVKISFFSGGGYTRNVDLLKKINLGDGSGRTLFDVADKVLSFSDLTDLGGALGGKGTFTKKYKKDLRKISSDLKNVVILEDNPDFFLNESQKKNLFWSGPGFRHFETYEDVIAAQKRGFELEYVPKNFNDWYKHRNKITMTHTIIEDSILKAEKEGIDLVDAMDSLRSQNSFMSDGLDLKGRNLIEEGRRRLKILPGNKPIHYGDDCLSAVLPLLFK